MYTNKRAWCNELLAVINLPMIIWVRGDQGRSVSQTGSQGRGGRIEKKKIIRQHYNTTPARAEAEAEAEAGLFVPSQLLYHPRYIQRPGSVLRSKTKQSTRQ